MTYWRSKTSVTTKLVEVTGLKVQVVDTNGAGDVHNGVVLAETARGTSFVETLQRANVAASVAVGRFGLAPCPTRDAVTQKLVMSFYVAAHSWRSGVVMVSG